jgi:hypothetical protein
MMSAIQGPFSFLDIGRRVNRIGIEFAALEEAQMAMPEGSEQYCRAHTKLVILLDEQTALQELALAMPARTLTDAAVQLGILFGALADIADADLGSQLQSGDLAQDLAKFERALAGITQVVADAAGLRLDEVAEPDLMSKLSQRSGAAVPDT